MDLAVVVIVLRAGGFVDLVLPGLSA